MYIYDLYSFVKTRYLQHLFVCHLFPMPYNIFSIKPIHTSVEPEPVPTTEKKSYMLVQNFN